MSKRHAPDALEERLDELLWHVAAEPDPATEVSAERIRADVSRWMKTRAEATEPVDPVPLARRARYPWARAAAVVLAVGGLCAAGYWAGWVGPPPRVAQTRSADAESWYVQVARAPESLRPVECTSDSWYCAEARPASSRRDL